MQQTATPSPATVPARNTPTTPQTQESHKSDTFALVVWVAVALCLVTGFVGIVAAKPVCVLAACAAWVAVASLDVWQTLTGWRNILATVVSTLRFVAIAGTGLLVTFVGLVAPILSPFIAGALFYVLLWKVFGSTSGEVETAKALEPERLEDIVIRDVLDQHPGE